MDAQAHAQLYVHIMQHSIASPPQERSQTDISTAAEWYAYSNKTCPVGSKTLLGSVQRCMNTTRLLRTGAVLCELIVVAWHFGLGLWLGCRESAWQRLHSPWRQASKITSSERNIEMKYREEKEDVHTKPACVIVKSTHLINLVKLLQTWV